MSGKPVQSTVQKALQRLSWKVSISSSIPGSVSRWQPGPSASEFLPVDLEFRKVSSPHHSHMSDSDSSVAILPPSSPELVAVSGHDFSGTLFGYSGICLSHSTALVGRYLISPLNYARTIIFNDAFSLPHVSHSPGIVGHPHILQVMFSTDDSTWTGGGISHGGKTWA